MLVYRSISVPETASELPRRKEQRKYDLPCHVPKPRDGMVAVLSFAVVTEAILRCTCWNEVLWTCEDNCESLIAAVVESRVVRENMMEELRRIYRKKLYMSSYRPLHHMWTCELLRLIKVVELSDVGSFINW